MSNKKEVKAIEMASDGETMETISRMLGFKSVLYFNKYREAYLDFSEQLDAARNARGDYMEDQIINVQNLTSDPKMADVLSKNLMKVAAVRKPQRYGDKLDLNINQTIDISGSLERAERRVIEAGKDPTNIITMTQKKLLKKKE